MIQLLFSLCLYLLSSNPVAVIDWDLIDKKSLSILSNISNEKFDLALEEVDSLSKVTKNLRIDLCYKAAIYYKMIEEYKTRIYEDKFKENIESAIKELENFTTDDKYSNARRMQFLASAYGYRGMYRTLRSQWDRAFLDGRTGYNILSDSLELAPQLIDNYAGIGTYLYWRSKKAGFVKYVLFWWGDKKEEGINDLKKAIEKGKLIKLWAMGGLLRIYIEEELWDTALKMADDLLAMSSSDSGTHRRKAYVLEKLGRKKEALEIFNKLYLETKTKNFNTSNAQIDLIYNILRLNSELKNNIDKTPFMELLAKLKSGITTSFSDIDDIVKKIERI